MAELSDLKLKYLLYMQVYPYRHIDWRPGAHLRKPLSEAKIAVITSAACIRTVISIGDQARIFGSRFPKRKSR
jgi:hypothetical protein